MKSVTADKGKIKTIVSIIDDSKYYTLSEKAPEINIKDLRDASIIQTEKRILAPVNAFEKAGTLKVLDSEDNLLAEADLIYLENVEELGFFQRLWAIFWDWLVSLFS